MNAEHKIKEAKQKEKYLEIHRNRKSTKQQDVQKSKFAAQVYSGWQFRSEQLGFDMEKDVFLMKTNKYTSFLLGRRPNPV